MDFRKLLGRFSGEQKGEKIVDARDRFRNDRRDEIRYPGMPRRLQSELREQNEGGEMDYFEASLRQRGGKFAADGSIVQLELVDTKENEPDPGSAEEDSDTPVQAKPYQPPLPPSVA